MSQTSERNRVGLATTTSPPWVWGLAIGLLAVYVVVAWLSRLPAVAYSNDDSIYMFLARSLLDGSYRDIHLVGAPLHVQYPPGWPAVLALASAVFGERPQLFVVIPLVCSTAGLALAFDVARRTLAPAAALAALALAVANPLMVRYGGRLMGEAEMFFLAMLALWALSVPAPSRRRLAVACAAAILAAFMRSAGIAVIGAVFLHFVLQRRWRWAIGLAAAAAVTFGPWLLWSFIGPGKVTGRSYIADLATVDANRAAEQDRSAYLARLYGMAYRAERYVSGHLHAVMGFPVSSATRLDNVAWYLLMASAGLTGAVAVWRRQRHVALYVVVAFAVLVVWSWSDRRFLHPLVPLVAIAFAAGAFAVAKRLLGQGAAWVGPIVLLTILLPRGVRETAAVVRVGLECDRANPVETCFRPAPTAFLRAAVYGKRLPNGSIVLVEREAAFAWHSGGKRTIHASNSLREGAAGFLPFVEAEGVTHILISRLSMNERVDLSARLHEHCRQLELVEGFGENTYLFRVRQAAELGMPMPEACTVTTELKRIGDDIRERVTRGEID